MGKVNTNEKEIRTYGVLFNSPGYALYYLDFEEKEVHKIHIDPAIMECNLPQGANVFFGAESKVKSLDGFESECRGHSVRSIQSHKDRILDAGKYGLYDSLENRCLISKDYLEKEEGIEEILSLITDQEGNLFALVGYTGDQVLFELIENQGDYSFGDGIWDWNWDNYGERCGRVVIVPWQYLENEGDRVYPFSLISCVEPVCLNLIWGNYEEAEERSLFFNRIKRTEVAQYETGYEIGTGRSYRYMPTSNRISCVEGLGIVDDHNFRLIYSKKEKIVEVTIDLRKGSILEGSKNIYEVDHLLITDLKLVTDPNLHQRLISGELK